MSTSKALATTHDAAAVVRGTPSWGTVEKFIADACAPLFGAATVSHGAHAAVAGVLYELAPRVAAGEIIPKAELDAVMTKHLRQAMQFPVG